MTGIHTEIFGSGKPLVLVHGWAMHSGVWLDFARELANYYQVICIDLPGHGGSEAIHPFNLENTSRVLAGVVKDQPCCWLGWSLGAPIGLQIAATYPAQVDSLVLLAGSPCFVAKNDWPGMAETVLDNFANNLMQDCRDTLIRFLGLQTRGLADQGEILRQLKTIVFSNHIPSLVTLEGGLDILKTADLRTVLAELKIPVAAILGQIDTLVPVQIGRQMQVFNPKVDLTVIERGGHIPFLTHQQATVAAVRRFMG